MDWILVGHHEASGLTLIIHNGNMGLPVQGPKTKIHEIVTYFELSLLFRDPLFLKPFHENVSYPLYNFRESDVSTYWYYLINWHNFSLCTSLINPIKPPLRTGRTILTQKIIKIIKIITSVSEKNMDYLYQLFSRL